VGGGLSSSAALEVAMATLLEVVAATPLSAREKALLCQRAEQEFAGVPAGIMDMYVSSAARAGHALLIDCRSLALRHVPFPAAVATLVVDTCIKHDLADGAYAQRRRECEQAALLLGVPSLRDADEAVVATARLPSPLHQRALHVVSENRRVAAAVDALSR